VAVGGATVRTVPFGSTPAGPAELVLLRGEHLEVGVSTLGAAVHVLRGERDPGARRHDLVLGLPDAEAALADACFVGAVAGRFANRIAHGRLSVDGVTHQLPTNDGPHTLHGGPEGFHRRLWRVTALDAGPVPRVQLELTSADGDMGFPGELVATVAYAVDGWSVRVELTAATSAPTVVNLTQHAYWNLRGDLGDVRDHLLRVDASCYLPVDDEGIPLGGPVPVEQTAYDLRAGRPLREANGGVVDHSYVLDRPSSSEAQVWLHDPHRGWSLEVSTDAPAVQVYTGGALTGRYRAHQGLCLETQWLPDTPHHEGEPGWPSTVLRPGELWRSTTRWRVVPAAPGQRRP
jgi:aldose 1-epimerase